MTIHDPVERLRICGEALYGSQWQTDLARALGMSVEAGTVRKMAAGKSRIMPRTWERIAQLMSDKRREILRLMPEADSLNADLDAIRYTLRNGSDDERQGCLIGIGQHDLARRLYYAARDSRWADEAYKTCPRRPVNDDDKADPEVVILQLDTVAIDPAEEDRLFHEMSEARGKLYGVQAEIRELADSIGARVDD